ncbi:hypothetical protein J3458_002100 [Metarhizium acridum]|uniref:Uncharacterized protein n=1 Tax=Metarhizium acridum (strain CQMa 102) TaxID=655827 RepID=E9EI64_METAQ|nr:uncharacterized protein MAC_09562 [Metarhizium acridum CQMa 102]EFY84386.1 hypothetical protein MAC_09562 [Metarhizium acridum CQMa 102]KAG8425395.1 hypothetical protein J3458_002100 [Metarhizium acridum]
MGVADNVATAAIAHPIDRNDPEGQSETVGNVSRDDLEDSNLEFVDPRSGTVGPSREPVDAAMGVADDVATALSARPAGRRLRKTRSMGTSAGHKNRVEKRYATKDAADDALTTAIARLIGRRQRKETPIDTGAVPDGV